MNYKIVSKSAVDYSQILTISGFIYMYFAIVKKEGETSKNSAKT
ncbi:MAG TPA: hypothetical protein VLA74_03165 [Nitrososphaeraceae archaeon]|nr:hypothetical protein [Nitrososphaeraceae archaeon]